MKSATLILTALTLLMGGIGQANATLITTYYGDDDGFGVGASSGSLDPSVSHADAGEAPFTDVRLIGNGFLAPPFAPTGGFNRFTIPFGDVITGATLTMRAGAWASGPDPVDGPNKILLNGSPIPTTFFGLFTGSGSDPGPIETRSISLDSSFFPILSDGVVSLNGTHISENWGSQSFQIDFLRLDIQTAASTTPEPASLALCGIALASIAGYCGWRGRQRLIA